MSKMRSAGYISADKPFTFGELHVVVHGDHLGELAGVEKPVVRVVAAELAVDLL
jgi:hypothetical protein